MSGDAYQVGELVASACPPQSAHIRIPTRLPINNVTFSKDHRLLAPTASGTHGQRLCTRATVAKGGLVHADKFYFFSF